MKDTKWFLLIGLFFFKPEHDYFIYFSSHRKGMNSTNLGEWNFSQLYTLKHSQLARENEHLIFLLL